MTEEERERLAGEVIGDAHRMASAKAAARPDLADALTDAATDAVLRALQKFDPGRGVTFREFALMLVRLNLRGTFGRAGRKAGRPVVRSLVDLDAEPGETFEPADHGRPIGGRIPLSPDLRDLPADLRDAVRFVYVDGYTLEDAGFLLGCVSKPTVSRLLEKAAAHLAADGAVKPVRPRGQKRVRGGKGH